MADNVALHGCVGRRTDAGGNSATAPAPSSQTEDGAQVSPPEGPGQPIVLDAYDPLPSAVLLFVLTAVTHLLFRALGVDATLEVFSRLVGAMGR
jgi:hypothetical protein